jgi:hypothetical protein
MPGRQQHRCHRPGSSSDTMAVAGALTARYATPRICVPAWRWVRCMSNPRATRPTMADQRLCCGAANVAPREALGYDRMLKSNTAKRRVHSLFRQGCMLYNLIPMMQRFPSCCRSNRSSQTYSGRSDKWGVIRREPRKSAQAANALRPQ